ncbi:pentatricopeptide repeat-containing protein PNM1, mitochondrial [Senna tora]|uniref:Pentatricopeptide repeat-containing protein PNM1, mitochondrial n=1 Tax=Senna tora TaxID=362788 RepID=A0A834X5F5_9FABA|nr:pentatricopeptide repeat-containing protein PNM1, mitochondrial [Senna tora]
MPPFQSLQLRRLLLRSFRSPSPSFNSLSLIQPRLPLPLPSESTSNPFSHTGHSQSQSRNLFTAPSLFLSRSFSSEPSKSPSESLPEDSDPIAQSLSNELLKDPDSDPLSVSQRLQLSFSHITPTPSLVLQTLNLSPEAGRTVLGFNQWLISSSEFTHTDETLSYFVAYFGRRKDFKATHEVLVSGRGIAGPKTLDEAVDRLVRAGRPTQAVSFFETMETDYGLERSRDSLRLIVDKLCEKGYASYAEKMVKNLANEFFPDETICDLLIKAWCVDGKLDEARRLAGEMYRGGFELGTYAYNAILDCVCKLCRLKDPFRLDSEVEKVLVDMDSNGVPRNVETFNVLITNLCKIRRTEDAMKLFYRIGEWGCSPNETTFLVLTKSLYQSARLEEGDEMIDRMKSAGFGEALDKKAYYQFLKILCGIERIDHALSVFGKMKADGCEVGIKTYDLLMGKLCAHNRIDKANALFNEAQSRGVDVTPKAYKVEARYMKKPKAEKKEKKRETLPEKMARKRRRLKEIRLSFVKKPKRMRRRAY